MLKNISPTAMQTCVNLSYFFFLFQRLIKYVFYCTMFFLKKTLSQTRLYQRADIYNLEMPQAIDNFILN